MTETNKPTPEQETLSRFLDELNAGEAPTGDTDEANELLEVAALLRQADLPVAPPAHLVNATVEQVLAEQPQPHKKQRTWLYSGLLGAAASVVLVIGLRLTPVVAPPLPSDETPAGITAIQNQPSTASAPAATTPSASEPALSQATAPPPPDAKRARGAEPQQTAPTAPVQPAPSAPAAAKPADKPVPVRTADSPPAAASVPPLEKRVLAENKSAVYPKLMQLEPAEPLVPLTWPGHTPATVSQDKASGQIKQVFYPNTKQELLLTQTPLKRDAPPSSRQVKTDAATGRTSVTLVQNSQLVTLDGFRSEAELLALAATLLPDESH